VGWSSTIDDIDDRSLRAAILYSLSEDGRDLGLGAYAERFSMERSDSVSWRLAGRRMGTLAQPKLDRSILGIEATYRW
jgi:hypothetical protein